MFIIFFYFQKEKERKRMRNLASWLLLLLVYCLILTNASSDCQFNLDVYEYRNETMILQGDLIGCQNLQHCRSMFIKVSLECDQKVFRNFVYYFYLFMKFLKRDLKSELNLWLSYRIKHSLMNVGLSKGYSL